jgi:O-antigen/teichoic acid export membrane protein
MAAEEAGPPGPAPDRRTAERARLYRGSAWLLGTVAVTALSGASFWLIAARAQTEAVVGDAAGLFSSILFVNYLTNLGLPVALARYTADDRHPTLRLYGLAAIASMGTSLLVAAAYLALLPDAERSSLDAMGLPGVAGFLFIAVGMAATVLVEVRLMALRRWGWVLGRVVLLALGRLVLIAFVPDDDASFWLFVAVALPPALSGLLGLVILRLTGHGPSRPWPLPRTAGPAARLAGVNWGALLAAQGPMLALPVLVLRYVTDDEYASLYIAWGIVLVVFLIPQTIGQLLLVEGGRDGAHLGSQLRICLAISTGLMAVLALATWVGKGIVTTVYGADYRDAADILPVLVGAGVLWAVTSTCLARARVREDSVATIAITGSFALATLVPALLLVPAEGLEGATVAWLVGNTVAAAVATATLLRRSTEPTPAPDQIALHAP